MHTHACVFESNNRDYQFDMTGYKVAALIQEVIEVGVWSWIVKIGTKAESQVVCPVFYLQKSG